MELFTLTITDVVATLALVIAAATFALQVKQWFDSRPRLHLRIIGDAIQFPNDDGKSKLALTMTNRGNEPTKLTHMVAFGYDSKWRRLRGKPSLTAIVNSPEIPAPLGPNRYWIGMMVYTPDASARREKGLLYVGVIGTHSDKTYLIQVPPKKAKPVAMQSTTQKGRPQLRGRPSVCRRRLRIKRGANRSLEISR